MENTVEAKLRRLFEIQTIDSKIDKIYAVRGELPMEVSDLEDEIEGLKTRIEKLNLEINELKSDIEGRKSSIKDSDNLIKKYDAQLGDVKNNREYLALTKEIELQKLEKMACDKKIKEYGAEIDEKLLQIKNSETMVMERGKDLEAKKGELGTISAETEKEEKELEVLRDEIRVSIEERLIKAYDKIRGSLINRLAVVTIEREACGGCFSQIPAQRQLDIATHKKIIVCEHCGRILIDHLLSEEARANVLAKTAAI